MNPISDRLFLTPLCDKSLQNTEILIVAWPIIFRIMDDEMFVMKRGYSFVYIGRGDLMMFELVILDAV